MIKTNFNQRYITDLVSTSILRILAEKGKVPIQDFIVRNDSPCGSTIGPILASGTGMKAIDIGIPMLGMHSIRETCGVIDTVYYFELFKVFYEQYETINHDLLDHWLFIVINWLINDLFNFLLVRICRTKILLEFFSGSQAIDKRIFFDELNDYLKFIRD